MHFLFYDLIHDIYKKGKELGCSVWKGPHFCLSHIMTDGYFPRSAAI